MCRLGYGRQRAARTAFGGGRWGGLPGKGRAGMGDSVLGKLVGIAVVVSLIALIVYTWARMGSYFDRRLSDSEEDVEADIERYGADAPGRACQMVCVRGIRLTT